MNMISTLERVCFFGASVTQQSSGYAAVLAKELNADVKVFGFGGMHLKDAGIIYIDSVLECNPDICFVDWFSTGYNECSPSTEEYIDTIIYRFTKASCKLVFLFFPYKEDPSKKAFHEFCKRFLVRRNMMFIDVAAQLHMYDVKTILRDNIHTNDLGSRLYADIIKRYYEKRADISFPSKINKTKYSEIQSLVVEKEFTRHMVITGDSEIIGVLLIVGPYSGIIRLSDDCHSYTLNTWDRWCYYTREHILIRHSIRDYLKISVLKDDFDTSSCKKDIDFSRIDKKLVVCEIYYIGNGIEVINLEDGVPLPCREV